MNAQCMMNNCRNAAPATEAFCTKHRGGSARRELADLIETRLFGVHPDDQDVVLEDHDWRLIINSLRGEAS